MGKDDDQNYASPASDGPDAHIRTPCQTLDETNPMTRETTLTLAAFQDILDAYGADPHRWPAQRRSAADALLATSDAARTALREARALDAVLAAVPSSAPPSAALRDRIVAAAVSSAPRVGDASAPSSRSNVVPLDARRAPRSGAPEPARADAADRRQLWRAATALAASLVTGMLIGTFDIAPAAVRDFTGLARSERDVYGLVVTLQSDGLSTVFDEDHL